MARRRQLVGPVCAVEPGRARGPTVALPAAADAATITAGAVGVVDKSLVKEERNLAEGVDFEMLAAELEGASPLEVMDRALEMFGNDIAIAFR